MSIFQSTVVLRHFVSQFVHRYMLGHTPFSESTRRLNRLSPFDLVVDPCELYTRAYPPSIGSLDLSHASLSFDLAVDPHELSYWGISPLAEFAYIVILVVLWFWATWSDHCHLLPVSLCSVRVETAPISIDHRLVSLRFWGRTYIDWPSSMSAWVLGSHIYLSIIVLSFWVLVFGAAPISTSHLPISLSSVWVFGVAPISIDHLPCQFEYSRIAPISINHFPCQFEFWDRTYIDRPLSFQFRFLGSHLYRSVIFHVSLSFRTTPISIGHRLFSLRF